MSNRFSKSMGKVVGEYTWLIVDALLLLFLLAGLLSYKDFDEPMRVLFRAAFVAFWFYIWISGLHLLIYLRHADREEKMPGFISYFLFFLKLVLIGTTISWASGRGLF